MAPRAIGLGATQITFIVVTALATTVGVGALADFNFAFVLLQIPLGIIGVPLGIVVLPTLSRDAAVGHETSFAALLTRALRLLVYVMVPITVLTVIVRQPVVEILFGSGRIAPAGPRPDRRDAGLLRGRADRARADRRPRPWRSTPARTRSRRSSPRSRRSSSTAAWRSSSSDRYGLQGIALAIAVAAWIEAFALLAILHHRLPHFELRGLARVGIEAVVGSALAGAVAFLADGWLTGAIGTDPGRLVLVVEVTLVSLVFGLVYAALSLVLRIPELPSIVGVMADVLRRPARS